MYFLIVFLNKLKFSDMTSNLTMQDQNFGINCPLLRKEFSGYLSNHGTLDLYLRGDVMNKQAVVYSLWK